MLDGQAASDADRAAAADYSTRQAELQAAALASEPVHAQDSSTSMAALSSKASRASALPCKATQPSLPQKGLTTLRSKSTGLRQKKSSDSAAMSAVPGERIGSSDVGASVGKTWTV